MSENSIAHEHLFVKGRVNDYQGLSIIIIRYHGLSRIINDLLALSRHMWDNATVEYERMCVDAGEDASLLACSEKIGYTGV